MLLNMSDTAIGNACLVPAAIHFQSPGHLQSPACTTVSLSVSLYCKLQPDTNTGTHLWYPFMEQALIQKGHVHAGHSL